jgi:hypothetical protein
MNVLRIGILLFKETMAYVVHLPFLVMTHTSGVQVQVWTRLGLLLLSTMNVLHIGVLLFGGTMAYIMHHPFLVIGWTRLGLLSTIKIHNLFHIHLLLPYRVTDT